MKANMLSLHTPVTPGVGSKGHFVFFSKSGHVAYQIKMIRRVDLHARKYFEFTHTLDL